MKTVFLGEVLNILPVDNGIVFSHVLERTEEELQVAYKMVTFSDGKTTPVPKSLYHLSKFGANYGAVLPHIKSILSSRALPISNDKTFLLNPDGSALIINNNSGEIMWEGIIKYRDNAPVSVAINNRSIWACFKESSVLMRFNLATMREELRIGSGSSSPFNKPQDLYIGGDFIYVSDTAENAIIKLNLNTYVTEVYRKFDRPLKQFIINEGFPLVVLEDGIFLLD